MEHQLQEKISMHGQLSSHFIRNEGQLDDDRISYYTEGSGYGAYFTDEGVQFVWNRVNDSRTEGLRLDFCFLNEGQRIVPKGTSPLVGKMNYFSRNGIQQRYTNVSTYEEIVYKNVWDGIDLIFKIEQGKIKYEFLVRPYVDIAKIRFTYEGVNGLSLDDKGNLVLDTPFGEMKDTHPISYHVKEDERVAVESAFQLLEENTVISFVVGDGYDKCLPLVIDPELVYSTFLMKGHMKSLPTVAIDQEGCAYIAGTAPITNLPPRQGAYEFSGTGENAIYVTKLNSSGTELIYCAYLGIDGSKFERFGPISVAVDQEGCAYVSGTVAPGSLETTPNAWQENSTWESVAFVTKLNPTGSTLVYSTLLSGDATVDNPNCGSQGIDIDSAGNVYIIGYTQSVDFETRPGAYRETGDGMQFEFTLSFICKLDADGENLLYSTFYPEIEEFAGIKVYSDGTVYIAGEAPTNLIPTMPDAYIKVSEKTLPWSGFVTKLNALGSDLVYSTIILDNSIDDVSVEGLAIDQYGCAYVTGRYEEESSEVSAYVIKLNEIGTDRMYLKTFGPTNGELFYNGGIAVDPQGHAYIVGNTESDSFPTTSDALQGSNPEIASGFITKLNITGEEILYSTYVGAESSNTDMVDIVVNDRGEMYVLGSVYKYVLENAPPEESVIPFPITSGAYDSEVVPNIDTVFVMHFGGNIRGKLPNPKIVADTICEAFTIQDNSTLIPVWSNQTRYTINGTVVIENKGELDGWPVELLINQYISGEEQLIVVYPGKMQAVTVDNLMTINIQGTGVGVGETTVEISSTSNW